MKEYINVNRGNSNVLLLAVFTLIIYLISVKFNVELDAKVVPFGDPFTYSIGFFNILDNVSTKGYFRNIYTQIFHHPNWYWLLNLLVSIFSPILSKNSFSISFCNFFMFFIASFSLYRVAIEYGAKENYSVLAGLLPWVFPINYGFQTYASIPMTGLDASFTAALYIALSYSLIFCLKPSIRRFAVIGGVTAGVAILGRGNSLPVVAMVLFLPLTSTIYEAIIYKNKTVIKNLIILLSIALAISLWFYFRTYEALLGYYSNHATFFSRHEWNLHDAKKWLLNIPGFLFWQRENSYASIIISFLTHLFHIYAVFSALRNIKYEKLKMLILTGSFIYFCTYFINVFLFTDPLFTLTNCILQYQPMLIGTCFALLGLIIPLLKSANLGNYNFIIYASFVSLIIFAYFFTKIQTPFYYSETRPPPKAVELFSLNLDEFTNNGSLSILWYGSYNPQILSYYRKKNDLPEANIYRGKFHNNMWSQSDYSMENKKRVIQEIADQFNSASVIIIPENLDLYGAMPYAFSHFREEIAKFLISKNAPKFNVISIIKENPTANLLVLQKSNISNGKGFPFDAKTYVEKRKIP